jgi:hypothetical protein
VNMRTASCQSAGFKQIGSKEPKLHVARIAKDIARLILDRQEDDRLRWRQDGSVCVQIGKIPGLESAFLASQTRTDRGKRFRRALEELLRNAGWRTVRKNVYAPPEQP